MSLRDKYVKSVIEDIMEKDKDLPFPAFMKSCRRRLRYSRKLVCQLLDWNVNALFYFEHGLFGLHGIDVDKLEKLIDLYGLDEMFVKQKYNKFIENRLLC